LLFQAIVLGIVQGLAEFIPISSSAHLVIIPWLFGWDNPVLNSLTFDVALHLGTLLAVLVFFASDWVRLIRAGLAGVFQLKIGEDPDRRMAWFLLLASVPGAVAGLLLESSISDLFHSQPIPQGSMILMAAALFTLALLLFYFDKKAQHQRGFSAIKGRDAFLIGVAQAFAIIPGVSRSGATMTAGLALGLQREAAARFSFLLSAPIIAGAGVKSAFDLIAGVQDGSVAGADLALFPVGFLTAAVAGFFCIKYLLAYLKKHSMNLFVYYRMVLAAIVLVAALLKG